MSNRTFPSVSDLMSDNPKKNRLRLRKESFANQPIKSVSVESLLRGNEHDHVKISSDVQASETRCADLGISSAVT